MTALRCKNPQPGQEPLPGLGVLAGDEGGRLPLTTRLKLNCIWVSEMNRHKGTLPPGSSPDINYAECYTLALLEDSMIMLVFEGNSGTRVQTHIWPEMNERDTWGKWVEVTWRTDTFSCAERTIYMCRLK